jgi:hypothetical protein
MSVNVIVGKNNFSGLTRNLRDKLSQTKKLRGIIVGKKVITFCDSDAGTITVRTKRVINRVELIDFLCSLDHISFGSSKWLSARSEHFPTILAINVNGSSATINLEFSR